MASSEAMLQLDHADCDDLTPAEIERLSRLTAPRRRRQFLVGHALLRALLRSQEVSVHLGCGSVLRFPADQAPRMDGDGQTMRLGLAHSGDWVFVAASFGRVGIDGECLKARAQWRELALAVCPELFEKMPPALQDFYRAWTLKEAWLKSLGEPATLDRFQSLRIRTPVPADMYTLTSWSFGTGVMSCLARSDAAFHWPLGQPKDFGLQQPAVWAMDVSP